MSDFEPNEINGVSAKTKASLPEGLQQRLDKAGVEEVDARPILAAGREPFQEIMQAVDRLGAGRVLRLRVPFEPVPLYAVLGRKGFCHWAMENKPDEENPFWEVFFYRNEDDGADEGNVDLRVEEESGGGDGSVIELDVRGLEPPESLERVLEAAERMAYGHVVKVVHHREPLILFDVLHRRGFGYRCRQKAEDFWEIRIWRKS